MLCLSDSQPDSARPKNVPGPIVASTSALDALNRPKKCSWTYLAVALRPHQTAPNLKNVPGPIAASTSVLDALNRPKKCSWTSLAVALHPHQTAPSLKNVPGPI